ncbi:MAG TPA: threonine-phosphate decarboxylase CobD [Xanthobacteraceae bacterium]|nr:threonine-phosphate decarboxylase CobD [Xanthobacteraceae bacterium]
MSAEAIKSRNEVRQAGADEAPAAHGGDLGAARSQFPGAPEPFIDLSTGINPHSYPIPQLAADLFTRLPEPKALDRVANAAAAAYGISADQVVVAPGTQILLTLVAGLVRPGRAAILGPTYVEHARAAARAGHQVQEVADLLQLGGAELAVVVNPNNPDGRRCRREALVGCADALAPGGLLVVDEAFMDALPDAAELSLAAGVMRSNIVVLRSFGKFFGLAGLRLGFALAAPALAARLTAALGPWAVSGPALSIGCAALQDSSWIAMTRAALPQAAARLDTILAGVGLEIIGGTPLFRLVRTAAAPALFDHLGHAGVLVRRFAEHPTWLRFGLPADEQAWRRLAVALVAFA